MAKYIYIYICVYKTAWIIRIFLAQGEQSREIIVLEDKDTIRNSSRDCA